jgi:hypothetical protein
VGVAGEARSGGGGEVGGGQLVGAVTAGEGSFDDCGDRDERPARPVAGVVEEQGEGHGEGDGGPGGGGRVGVGAEGAAGHLDEGLRAAAGDRHGAGEVAVVAEALLDEGVEGLAEGGAAAFASRVPARA